jgi:two-component system, OmpR family, sensor histidine kinase MtrB
MPDTFTDTGFDPRTSKSSLNMSLRRSLTVFVVALTGLALAAAVSLILLTTYLHRTTVDLEAGLHSVRLAEEMQIDLLKYMRVADDASKREILTGLRQKVIAARKYAGVPEESAALAEAASIIEYRLSQIESATQSDDADVQRAFEALRRFVDLNVDQSEASLKKSEGWDDMGDLIGIGVAGALTVGIAVMLVWLSMAVFRPVFEIRDAVKDFTEGRKAARAPEHGPEELRSIASQFNRMADSLSRQHDNQLAFLAAVAHDLRNPLSALKVSAEVLSRGGTIPHEKVSSVMAIIGRQVQQLDRMVGDLLDASSIEAGRLELRFEECDARKIAQESFDLFSSASPKHEFILKLPDHSVPLHCDPLRMGQVVNNLLSNAIKYSPAGGKVLLSVEQQGLEVSFSVSDEGVGIPGDELPYIFEPFRRSPTSREDIPGVGLGLSVAQRIVQGHGGRIQAESRVGKGTKFRVHLQQSASPVALKHAV